MFTVFVIAKSDTFFARSFVTRRTFVYQLTCRAYVGVAMKTIIIFQTLFAYFIAYTLITDARYNSVFFISDDCIAYFTNWNRHCNAIWNVDESFIVVVVIFK